MFRSKTTSVFCLTTICALQKSLASLPAPMTPKPWRHGALIRTCLSKAATWMNGCDKCDPICGDFFQLLLLCCKKLGTEQVLDAKEMMCLIESMAYVCYSCLLPDTHACAGSYPKATVLGQQSGPLDAPWSTRRTYLKPSSTFIGLERTDRGAGPAASKIAAVERLPLAETGALSMTCASTSKGSSNLSFLSSLPKEPRAKYHTWLPWLPCLCQPKSRETNAIVPVGRVSWSTHTPGATG